MNSNTLVKIMIPAIGLSVAVVIALVGYFVVQSWWSQPPAVLGFGDGPQQPIAFPHTTHVSQAGIDCQFCHRTVSTDEAASIPAVAQCQFCHDFGKIDGTQSDSDTAAIVFLALLLFSILTFVSRMDTLTGIYYRGAI